MRSEPRSGMAMRSAGMRALVMVMALASSNGARKPATLGPGGCSGDRVVLDVLDRNAEWELGMAVDMRQVEPKPNSRLGPLWPAEEIRSTSTNAPLQKQAVLVEETNIEVFNQYKFSLSVKVSAVFGLIPAWKGFIEYLSVFNRKINTVRASLTMETRDFEVSELEESMYSELVEASAHFDEATHIVTRIRTGVRGAFTFDYEMQEGENRAFIRSNMGDLISGVPRIADVPDELKKFEDGFRGFHERTTYGYVGDMPFEFEPETMEDVGVQVASWLRETARFNGGKGVVLQVDLEPLCKWLKPEEVASASQLLFQELSDDSVSQILALQDELQTLALRAEGIAQAAEDLGLSRMQALAASMRSSLTDFLETMRSEVGKLVPLVRATVMDAAELDALMTRLLRSPFAPRLVQAVLSGMEDELAFFGSLTSVRGVTLAATPDLEAWAAAREVVVIALFIEAGTAEQLESALRNYLTQPSDNYIEVDNPRYLRWINQGALVRLVRDLVDKDDCLVADGVCNRAEGQQVVVLDYRANARVLDAFLDAPLESSQALLMWGEGGSGPGGKRVRQRIYPALSVDDPRDPVTADPIWGPGEVPSGKRARKASSCQSGILFEELCVFKANMICTSCGGDGRVLQTPPGGDQRTVQLSATAVPDPAAALEVFSGTVVTASDRTTPEPLGTQGALLLTPLGVNSTSWRPREDNVLYAGDSEFCLAASGVTLSAVNCSALPQGYSPAVWQWIEPPGTPPPPPTPSVCDVCKTEHGLLCGGPSPAEFNCTAWPGFELVPGEYRQVELDACVNNPCGPREYCVDLPPPALDAQSGRQCLPVRLGQPGFETVEPATARTDAVYAACEEGWFQPDAGYELRCEQHRVVDCAEGEVLERPPSPVQDGVCKVCPEGTRPDADQGCVMGVCLCVPIIYSPVLHVKFPSVPFSREEYSTEDFREFMAASIKDALALQNGVKVGRVDSVDGTGVRVAYQIEDDIEDDEAVFTERIVKQVKASGDKYGLTAEVQADPRVMWSAVGAGVGTLVLIVGGAFGVRRVRRKLSDRDGADT